MIEEHSSDRRPASAWAPIGASDDAVTRRGTKRRHWQREPGDPGEPVSDAEAEDIARTIVLNRLDRSAASRGQLADLLAKRLVPDDIADRVLTRFEDVGLIDDVEYAKMLVRTRFAERHLAPRALRAELARNGIGDAAADAALAQIDGDDELAAARAIVAKRLRQPSLAAAPIDVQKRRLLGALGRKGHGPGVAYRVIDEALRDGQGEEPRR